MTNYSMKDALRAAKGLGDRQRLRILALLKPGELCVCQIVAVLELAPSTVSKHLSLLEAGGLVACRKEGRWAHYRLAEGREAEGVRLLLRWAEAALEGDETAARDARALKRILACPPEDLCRRQRKGRPS